MDLRKVMVAKNVSEIRLYFANKNNQFYDDEREKEGVDGQWNGEVAFKDGEVRVEVDIPFGTFDEVVANMKEIMDGTYDYGEGEGDED